MQLDAVDNPDGISAILNILQGVKAHEIHQPYNYNITRHSEGLGCCHQAGKQVGQEQHSNMREIQISRNNKNNNNNI